MLQHYIDTINSFAEFQEKLQDLLAVLPQSPEIFKMKGNLKKTWDKSQRLLSEFEKYMNPVNSIQVKIPGEFENEKFTEAWVLWKEYLEEQHCFRMKSRMEAKAINILYQLSDHNSDKAIDIINNVIGRGSKNFYKIDDTAVHSKTGNYDPDFNK
ncbi:MAG: hypothetical protein PHX80_05315 [Candidatus Nanoarchaeia archaeon]|nr:hypothetical protein [Candidatus Nanoarchaeia archaeon]